MIENRSRAFAPSGAGAVVGVGVDVVGIARLSAMLERTPALLPRLLAPSERGLSPASRAARVAAKEAIGKALGEPGDFSWQDVTVARTRAGRPYAVLSGATLAAAERLGVTDLHLSLSHDADVATAVVVAERGLGAGGAGPEGLGEPGAVGDGDAGARPDPTEETA